MIAVPDVLCVISLSVVKGMNSENYNNISILYARNCCIFFFFCIHSSLLFLHLESASLLSSGKKIALVGCSTITDIFFCSLRSDVIFPLEILLFIYKKTII